MQFYSYDLHDPIYDFDGWHISFQVITLENIYGLNPSAVTITRLENGWQLDCSELSFAGQQMKAEGTFRAEVLRDGNHLRLKISASAPHKIRIVKVLLRDLPKLKPLDMLDIPRDVPEDGLIDRYPNPLRSPVWMVQHPNQTMTGIYAEDAQHRAKRFAIYEERIGALRGSYTVELIHEADARHFSKNIAVPDWVIKRDTTAEALRNTYLTYAETHAGLIPYENRTDIPAWTRDIRLCLTLHGMHWSGYVFNSYDDMRRILRFVADRADGKHVLAYLPGWEGRYYWQYGDFRPDPRLGGEREFHNLCDTARELGIHVMPMFGGNCANQWSPNFHIFGADSHMKTATRNRFHGNQPDWDMSRTHDTGWQAWLNPGAPAWQNELVMQITTLINDYGFDAVFLDTVEVWTNDPDFNIREGYRAIVDCLHATLPELLVTGEDWYDGLLPIFPIFQQTGHWRDVPEWVGRYARLIGHICDSEPGRGSTGVFEWGYTPYQRLPNHAPYIATIAFVEDTLKNAQEEIEAVIKSVF